MCSLEVLTRVKGPSVQHEPSVHKSVLLKVDAAPQATNVCATEAVATVASRKVSSLEVRKKAPL